MTQSERDPAAVRTVKLSKRFGDVVALASVDLEIGRGEFFGLIGPNGAGKSTLLRILTTLCPLSSGLARVCGHDLVHQAAAVRRCIGYVPQAASADRELTGFENLLLA